jgi:GT2 family glycosyltransferase
VLDRQTVGGAADSPMRLGADEAGWLSPSALLLVGPLGAESARGLSVSLAAEGEAGRIECRSLVLSVASTGAPQPVGVLAATLPDLESALNAGAALVFDWGGTRFTLGARDLKPLVGGLQSLARRNFAPVDAETRKILLGFLASTMDGVPKAERRELSKSLFELREALRERMPRYTLEDNQTFGLNVDRILAVDDRSFYFEGWINDEAKIARVTVVSPEGSRADVLARMFRFSRPDVAQLFPSRRIEPKHGFLCYVELDSPSLLSDGWLVEMETAAGVAVEAPGPSVDTDSTAVRDAILKNPVFDRMPDEELMSQHVHPAITRIQKVVGSEASFEEVVQFGTAPAAPEVSIVVPLYKRIDHLEMQLAEFVSDPEIPDVDLIYVLDSPEQSDELLEMASQLTPLYQVPFRVGILERNAGFAEANNAGALLAKARLLLLLNSDILPDAPGWLSRMQQFYDSTPNIGALGAKLLYEDDSIQHAGMYFYNLPGTAQWVDAHYFKGMHRSLPAANVARPVPIVSGACMMIDHALYQRFGGLRGIFVRGDYEDSDLCLRLSGEGLDNWYFPGVELYHLEGQSYTSEARRPANRYNMWLHSHLWGDRIAALMESADGAGPA